MLEMDSLESVSVFMDSNYNRHIKEGLVDNDK